MKIIVPYYKIETPLTSEFRMSTLALLEAATRTCYKSEDCTTTTSAAPFVRKIAQVKKHRSVIEHVSVTVRFICDRGISHELVRHRLASFSQESTRYCNYSKDKFDNQLTFIRPCFCNDHGSWYEIWATTLAFIESQYLYLLKRGASPQEARAILPNSLKTEVVMTANLREWHHVLSLRTATAAHPQMRELMLPLLAEFTAWMPEIFDDIKT